MDVLLRNRLEDLLEDLAGWLRDDPLPPLATETIVVPGQGLGRWLQQELAARHGIAAGLALPFPGAFLRELLGARRDGDDPFAPEVLRWRIWRLLGDPERRPAFGPAAAYCADDPDGRKRWQLAERVAKCFDDYQLYRPGMLEAAAAGDDLIDLGTHGPWQARLWRELVRDAGQDAPDPHRVRRLREVLADPGRARVVLPPRLAVFGAVTLPPEFLGLLRLAAAHVPVRLYVLHPAHGMPADLEHPLTTHFGAEANEFASALLELETKPGPEVRIDHQTPLDDEVPCPTALAQLQRDLAGDVVRGPDRTPPAPLQASDASLRVHDCHSPQRELEVVRDQILAAFAEDPRLEPHEVLVLVPDVARYAPFAHAVFGPLARCLPHRVADKSPLAELPLCASLLDLLRLGQGRLELPEVLRVLEAPAVARRFGLATADLPALRHRLDAAGVRWGRDGHWRETHCGVPAFDENSWRLGLDRLLLGAATGPLDALVTGLLPVADTTDGRDEVLAGLAAFAERLFAALDDLRAPKLPAEWADTLDRLLADFFAPDDDDERARQELRSAIARLRAETATAALGAGDAATLPVLLEWLEGTLGRGTSARGFCAGAVTIAAMLPMRAVPVKHLFVCGLDDASFPRRDQPAPFDLVAAHRRRGDRSSRLDDRQMFLDALLAARERLHLTYVGRSQRDDSTRAPSVVLDELLDVVDATFVPPPGCKRARDAVVVAHPLQPWSPRYRDGSDPRLFTFAAGLPTQFAKVAPEAPWANGTVAPPAELAGDEVPLAELLGFWNHPSRYFLRNVVGIRLPDDDTEPEETEPFSFGGLAAFQLRDGAVQRAVRHGLQDPGPLPADFEALARASGRLPAGGRGALTAIEVADEVREVLRLASPFLPLRALPVQFPHEGLGVSGTLDGVGRDRLVVVRASKSKANLRLRAFVQHVVAAVARHAGADLPDRTVLVALDDTTTFRPLDATDAADCLGALLSGFRAGLAAPLPYFPEASAEYAKRLAEGKSPDAALAAARSKFSPTHAESRSEADDRHVAQCWRGAEPLATPAFAEWARRIAGALLAAEEDG